MAITKNTTGPIVVYGSGSVLDSGPGGSGGYTTEAIGLSDTKYYDSSVGFWAGDTTELTVVFAIYPTVFGGTGNGNYIYRNTGAANDFGFGAYSAGGVGFDTRMAHSAALQHGIQYNTGGFTMNAWNAFGICCKWPGGPVGTFVHNGTARGTPWNYYTTIIVEAMNTRSPMRMGGFNDAFGISHIWAHPTYIDLTNPTNWAKFFDGDNKPVDLGSDGSTPTGSQPYTFAPDGDLSNNLGSGANWTPTGSPTTYGSSPTD